METGLTLNEYQAGAWESAFYPGRGTGGLTYPALKLCGESGEVADKVGKILRDEGGAITAAKRLELVLELGDVLWYIAALGEELNFSLEDIAKMNLRKLKDRKDRGVLGGSGDER